MSPIDFRFKMLAGDRIYVVLDDLPEKSTGGLYLPQTQTAASRIGTVKQVGPDVKLYKEGDKVIASIYAGVGLYLIQDGMVDATHTVYREGELMGTI